MDYPNFEVLLVDNASTDESVSRAQQLFGTNPLFKIVKNPQNEYTQGFNIGCEVATGEYLVFLNNDTRISTEFLSELTNVLDNDSRIALAQGKLLSDADPSRIDSVGETMDVYGNPITLGAGEADTGQYSKITEILSASGSAFIVRKKVLDEVGLFDRKFHMGYEDMDLALRVRLRGYNVVFVPKAIVFHKRGATNLTEELKLEVRHHFVKNRLATLIKNYAVGNLIRTIPMTFFLMILAFVWEACIKSDMKLAVRRLTGMSWTIRELRYILIQRATVQRTLRRVSDEKIFQLMPRNIAGVILSFIRSKKTW